MESDLLSQLKDIHMPTEPFWWPPAAGWWLLALAALVVLVLAVRWLQRWVQRQRPVKQARRLYAEIHGGFHKGALSNLEYLNASNELLKRLIIHGLGDDRARKANDEAWLALLDHWSGSTEFTGGAGNLLGNCRFQPDAPADVDALHPLLHRFLRRLRA